ncbi:unnamed protein product, partial [Mesorhabditis spiculigera]
MSFARRIEYDEDAVSAKRARGDMGDRVVEPPAELHELLSKLGDPGPVSLESSIEEMVTLLDKELEHRRQKVIDVLTSCVVYMPHKLTVYSTLVGLLNAKHYTFGGEIVEKLCADLQAFLEAENYNYSLHLSIFLCDLGNCRVLSLNSVVEFLEGYLEAAFEEDIPQVRADWFVYAVLHSLPWIGGELAEKKTSELDNILDGLSRYIEARSRNHVELLQVWTGAGGHDQEDYLDSLWAQMTTLREAGWKEQFIGRHYIAFDDRLQDALQHNLPTFNPPPHSTARNYPSPWIVFRLFDYTHCPPGPVLPGAHSIERFLIDEEINWILEQNLLDPKQCVKALLNYPKRAQIPLHYCIMEVFFSQMLRLPAAPHNHLVYASVIIDLCNNQAATVPQVLGVAVELLYDRLDTMQPVCVDRLQQWFTFNLANMDYQYEWAKWGDCLDKGDYNNKKVFVREVIERCLRFSYYDKIKERFNPFFKALVPPPQDVICPMDNPDHPEYERGKQFGQLFQEKAPADRFLPELTKEGGDGFDGDAFATFLSMMLKLASKSFSHNFSALMKYHKVLKEVCDSSEDMQGVLLRTLYTSWKNNIQYIVVMIDKYLKAQVIDCGVLVEWIFSDEMRAEHHRQWPWEVLNSALIKLSKHVANLRKEVDQKKQKKPPPLAATTDDDGMVNEKEDEMDDGDDNLHTKQQHLDNLVDFEKNLFLAVLHKFSIFLTEHVVLSEREGKEYRDEWFQWMMGRFREIFLQHHGELYPMRDELQEKLFSTAEIATAVTDVFKQSIAFRS